MFSHMTGRMTGYVTGHVTVYLFGYMFVYATGHVTVYLFGQVNSLYRFILKYTKTTLPDIETKSALAKLSEKAHSDLDKLKNKNR